MPSTPDILTAPYNKSTIAIANFYLSFSLSKKKTTTTNFTGDIIHLLGYYPEPPTTERPRPVYKPIYTYPKPTSTIHHPPARPWDHETNHISSPSYHPLVVNPDDHFGMVDDGGYGVTESDAAFSHHTYNDYKPGHHNYNEADDNDDYRPFEGTIYTQFLYNFFLNY